MKSPPGPMRDAVLAAAAAVFAGRARDLVAYLDEHDVDSLAGIKTRPLQMLVTANRKRLKADRTT